MLRFCLRAAGSHTAAAGAQRRHAGKRKAAAGKAKASKAAPPSTVAARSVVPAARADAGAKKPRKFVFGDITYGAAIEAAFAQRDAALAADTADAPAPGEERWSPTDADDEVDGFVFDTTSADADATAAATVSSWLDRYRSGPVRQAAAPQGGAKAVALAFADDEAEDEEGQHLYNDALESMDEAQKVHVFAEAKALVRNAERRWGSDSVQHRRRRVEERELARQVKAHDIIMEKRRRWNLHPVHFVKRWDTRLDRWGEDIVPYSQEKLEKEVGKYVVEDALLRQKLEKRYAEEYGWAPEAMHRLLDDFIQALPEHTRFFQSGYYKSMRPVRKSAKQFSHFQEMKDEQGIVVFEERHAHKVIREAVARGAMPFVKLPKPPLIWEPVPRDLIIEDNILGHADVTLERRQGAILLRRWLPNGQKISCEVLGGEHVDVRKPELTDWMSVEEDGGFLIHATMCNSVDHPNNFRVVTSLRQAVDALLAFHVDDTVDFTPNDYMFYPYLWVTNPNAYLAKHGHVKNPMSDAAPAFHPVTNRYD